MPFRMLNSVPPDQPECKVCDHRSFISQETYLRRSIETNGKGFFRKHFAKLQAVELAMEAPHPFALIPARDSARKKCGFRTEVLCVQDKIACCFSLKLFLPFDPSIDRLSRSNFFVALVIL